MISDSSSALTGLGAVALAALGARRRAHQPVDRRPTAGERFAEQGTDLARAVATAGGGLGRLAAGAAAGILSVAGATAAGVVRGGAGVSTSVGGGVVALAGELTARAGGLVLDGTLAITDLVRGRSGR